MTTRKSNNSARKVTTEQSENLAAAAIEPAYTKKEVMRYLHTSFFYPIIIMRMKEIENGNSATFPRLTTTLVYQNLPSETPTTQGH